METPTTRLDMTTDHFIRHNPGEADTEYNNPDGHTHHMGEEEEMTDEEFLQLGIDHNIIVKRGRFYYYKDNDENIASGKAAAILWISQNQAVINEISQFL